MKIKTVTRHVIRTVMAAAGSPPITHGDLAASPQQSMAGPLTEIIKKSKYSNRTVTLIQQSGR